jgi:diaminopimelate decarboxylase
MSTNLALQHALAHFERTESELLIGGLPITQLAAQYGTPLYIYSTAIIRQRHAELRASIPHEVQIYYAIKANPHPEIIALMDSQYDGFDISSRGELEQALTAGASPEKLSFAGPGKRIDELELAIDNGIGTISLESEQEAQLIQDICRSRGLKARVMIRVNPEFELTQSGMAMSGPRQFGIDAARVPQLIESLPGLPGLDFQGIHIFSGSQNLSAVQLIEHYDKIIGYALDLRDKLTCAMPVINIGGGVGIPYFAHEKELDLAALGTGLKNVLDKYRSALTGTTVRMELGRYIVGECGIYLCRVLYRKLSHDRVFLIIDGGMHQHLAASGNLGQSLARRPMPLVTANGLDRPLEKVIVAGVLCTPLDTFGAVELSYAQEGDLIAVMNSGAYGITASPTAFLSHKPPREIIL